MTYQQTKYEPILGNRKELTNAREFILDVIADTMLVEEAQEIVDSWSNLKVCAFIEKNWTGGIAGWSQRGEREYR